MKKVKLENVEIDLKEKLKDPKFKKMYERELKKLKKIKVYLNDKDNKRKIVTAELLKDNKTSIIVRLPDGNIIKRKKKRDLVKIKNNKDVKR